MHSTSAEKTPKEDLAQDMTVPDLHKSDCLKEMTSIDDIENCESEKAKSVQEVSYPDRQVHKREESP